MAAWVLQDAEQSAKEVFGRAFSGEPQILTSHGIPSLVVITYADFETMRKDVPAKTKIAKADSPSLLDALRSCPYDISELIEDRSGYDIPSAFERAGGFDSEEF